jgi:PEP-CTERM motif
MCTPVKASSIRAGVERDRRNWNCPLRIIARLLSATALLWHIDVARAQGFSSTVDAAVQINEGGAGQTDEHQGATSAIAAFSDLQHGGSSSGVIDLTSPVRFHASAKANVAAGSFGQTSAGVSLAFLDTLHGQASDSLKIQIDNGDLHFYILEQVTATSTKGNGSELLKLEVQNLIAGHSVQQEYGAANRLRLDLDPVDEGSLLAGGLDVINTMSVAAGADAFTANPVYDSNWDFSDTADLSYFYLTDQNGVLVSGLTITGDSGIQYPVNQPLPTPEPSTLALSAIGALSLAARVFRQRRSDPTTK